VWLRAIQLRKTAGRRPTYYSQLQAYDRDHDTRLAKRAYHGDTFADGTDAYISALQSQRYFGQYFGTINERTDCTAAVRTRIRNTLNDIGVALAAGSRTLGNRIGRN
jgi:hypothetical protein